MLLFYAAMIDDEADQLRFEDIYYSYRKQMLYVARQILCDPNEAEDAVQAALLGIAKCIKTVPAGNPKVVRAYVLVAAQNAALGMLPKKKQREEMLNIDDIQTASSEDVFTRITLSQDYESLLRAMGQLSDIYWEVLMLRYVQHLSENQIAQLLGRKPATVHQQITRGKKALVSLCRKEGMDLG